MNEELTVRRKRGVSYDWLVWPRKASTVIPQSGTMVDRSPRGRFTHRLIPLSVGRSSRTRSLAIPNRRPQKMVDLKGIEPLSGACVKPKFLMASKSPHSTTELQAQNGLFYWSHITRRAGTSLWGITLCPICGVLPAIFELR